MPITVKIGGKKSADDDNPDFEWDHKGGSES
jgi:hypothetical protein